MAYRITPNGMLETDSAQEAVELYRLLHAKAKVPQTAEAPTKRKYNRRQAPPAKPGEADTTVRTRRPELAVEHGVKIGQIWRKRWDKNKNYRTIQVAQLKANGIMPKILKPGGTSDRKSAAKFMSYSHLAENYVLEKDV